MQKGPWGEQITQSAACGPCRSSVLAGRCCGLTPLNCSIKFTWRQIADGRRNAAYALNPSRGASVGGTDEPIGSGGGNGDSVTGLPDSRSWRRPPRSRRRRPDRAEAARSVGSPPPDREHTLHPRR